MNIENKLNINLSGKKVTVFGAGKSGIASVNLLLYIGAIPFLTDINEFVNINDIYCNYEIGGHSKKALDCELIIISPGISDKIEIIQKAKYFNIPIVSEIELASWFTETPIMAITGSNGKTTTTMLLHEMCICANLNSQIVGNIGTPFSQIVVNELLGEIKPDVFVVEVSSFQLEHIYHFSPKVSSILNIKPDHLDRYSNYQGYINAKLNITKNLKESDFFVYNSDDEILLKNYSNSFEYYIPFSLNMETRAPFHLNNTKVYYSEKDKHIPLYFFNECKLIGNHNIQNILASATMAKCFGINEESIREAILKFNPVPHRIEFIGQINGINCYNDSKATNLDAVNTAVSSFKNPIILILGGKDKGDTNFKNLNLNSKVKQIICYGESAQYIYNQLDSFSNKLVISHFEKAVKSAFDLANENDVLLLSPGCASFDQFNNYAERGDTFKNILNEFQNQI